jgi:hypothetical protein
MKKTVMVIGLLLAIVCGVFAQVSVAGQTLYYQYLYSIDSETEVRTIEASPPPYFSEPPPSYKTINKGFITFTRNSCYESNAQGISTGGYTHAYQGEQNNMLVFYVDNYTYEGTELYFYFSKDFKRLNVIILEDKWQDAARRGYGNFPTEIQKEIVGNRTIHIYEQTTPASPKPQETRPAAPDRMW